MYSEMEKEKPWVYSHTQLALWKLCKRRYYNRYVLGKKEPTTPNMAAGTWLAQEPIEAWEKCKNDDSIDWNYTIETLWPNFLAEFGGDESFKDRIFKLDLARRILAAYKANPVQGKVVEIEKTFVKDFASGLRYSSKPDFIVERDAWTEAGNGETHYTIVTAWDIKLKTFNQSREDDLYFAKAELSPFDDQGLGQAILAGAQAFGQIVFLLGKKDGTLVGPIYLEHPVNPVLATEWEQETVIELWDIERWRSWYTHSYPWSKNDQACHAFGKPCTYLPDCNFGFEPKETLT